MKTELISITPAGTGKDKALELTEKTAAFCGLDHKSALRLRLLSEELIELMRNFTGELKGNFWLEAKDSTVEIHLKTEIPMDLQTRKELLSVSTSGKNAAAKGFMGKIRDMISTVTLPEDPETKADRRSEFYVTHTDRDAKQHRELVEDEGGGQSDCRREEGALRRNPGDKLINHSSRTND